MNLENLLSSKKFSGMGKYQTAFCISVRLSIRKTSGVFVVSMGSFCGLFCPSFEYNRVLCQKSM